MGVRAELLSKAEHADLLEEMSHMASELIKIAERERPTRGRKEHGTKQTFGRDLKAALPSLRSTRPRDDDNRHRSYEGIGLKGTSAQ